MIRAASILGLLLMAVGMLSLAYFASPVRLMFHSPMGLTEVDPWPSILGGAALVSGLLLIFIIGSRKDD